MQLPEATFTEELHQVGYLAHKLGFPFPVRILDDLWQKVCTDHPAYRSLGLTPTERISGILYAFLLAGEEAAERRHRDVHLAFTLPLPVLTTSRFSGRKVVRRRRIRLVALMHMEQESQVVFTLGLAQPEERKIQHG